MKFGRRRFGNIQLQEHLVFLGKCTVTVNEFGLFDRLRVAVPSPRFRFTLAGGGYSYTWAIILIIPAAT